MHGGGGGYVKDEQDVSVGRGVTDDTAALACSPRRLKGHGTFGRINRSEDYGPARSEILPSDKQKLLLILLPPATDWKKHGVWGEKKSDRLEASSGHLFGVCGSEGGSGGGVGVGVGGAWSRQQEFEVGMWHLG